MRDFSPEKLEQLQAYLNSDISDLQKSINDIQLFDYDGIYGTDLIHSIQTYAGEFNERNYDAAIKVRLAFENVWDAEYRGSAVLNEVKGQLKEYNRYVQGLSEVMRSGRCSSLVSTRLYVGGLNRKVLEAELIGSGDITRRLYPRLKVPTISELEIQQKISQITTTVLRNPQIIGILNRETKRLFIKTFERLYNEAEQIVEPFVLKLEELKYDCTTIIEDLKMYIYSHIAINDNSNSNDENVQVLTIEEVEGLKDTLSIAGVPSDFSVDKVVVLNQSSGAGTFGHNALMLIGEDGSGLLYSYGGNFTEDAFVIFMGESSESHMDRYYLNREEVEAFFTGEEKGEILSDWENGGADMNATPYNRGAVIDVTSEQGWQMISAAESIRNNESDEYNLYYNNCGQVASRILLAADIHYANPYGTSLQEKMYGEDGVYNEYTIQTDIATNGVGGTACSLAQFIMFSCKDGTIPNVSYRIEWFNSEWTSGYLEEIYEVIKDE